MSKKRRRTSSSELRLSSTSRHITTSADSSFGEIERSGTEALGSVCRIEGEREEIRTGSSSSAALPSRLLIEKKVILTLQSSLVRSLRGTEVGAHRNGHLVVEQRRVLEKTRSIGGLGEAERGRRPSGSNGGRGIGLGSGGEDLERLRSSTDLRKEERRRESATADENLTEI